MLLPRLMIPETSPDFPRHGVSIEPWTSLDITALITDPPQWPGQSPEQVQGLVIILCLVTSKKYLLKASVHSVITVFELF